MKIFNKTLAIIALGALVGLGATSCSDKEAAKPAAKGKPAAAATDKLPNYRYVDLDTILTRYNLAKDYNEEMVRMQANAEAQMKQHQTRIQQFATSVQNKMQNNGYLTEQSYKQDEQKMANMQNAAQQSIAGLQNNIEQAAYNAQKAINDSVTAFIEQYNTSHGYDAIFFKNATLYINPALDITDEVVEGLNARYNKVKK